MMTNIHTGFTSITPISPTNTHNIGVPTAVQLPLGWHGQAGRFALSLTEEARTIRVPRFKIGRRQEGRDHRF